MKKKNFAIISCIVLLVAAIAFFISRRLNGRLQMRYSSNGVAVLNIGEKSLHNLYFTVSVYSIGSESQKTKSMEYHAYAPLLKGESTIFLDWDEFLSSEYAGLGVNFKQLFFLDKLIIAELKLKADEGTASWGFSIR